MTFEGPFKKKFFTFYKNSTIKYVIGIILLYLISFNSVKLNRRRETEKTRITILFKTKNSNVISLQGRDHVIHRLSVKSIKEDLQHSCTFTYYTLNVHKYIRQNVGETFL